MVQSVEQDVVPVLSGSDRELLDQVRRAARSVALDVAEGVGVGRGKRRDQHFRIALGSAREVMAVIDLVVALGLAEEDAVAVAADHVDHVCAMLWKLTHGRQQRTAA